MSAVEDAVGSSEWMETIHFRDGRMCFKEEDQDDHKISVPSDLAAVSLGCSCGVKLSFRKMGLESATLPLDWNRTRIEKVIEFLKTDFSGFLTDLSGPVPVPNTKLSAFRGESHSFWHDNLLDPEIHIKLQRRVERFLQLGASCRQMLFVRSLATSDELALADELYAELVRKFGNGGSTKVYLLVIVCVQTVTGPVRSLQSPGLFIYQLGKEAHGPSGGDAAPFCDAISWALRTIQGEPASPARQVASATALLESGAVAANSIGLDGMEGVLSFETSQADKDKFCAGQRVEAWYFGTWYKASVLTAPLEHGNYWKVHCDVDPAGTNCTTHRLREMPQGIPVPVQAMAAGYGIPVPIKAVAAGSTGGRICIPVTVQPAAAGYGIPVQSMAAQPAAAGYGIPVQSMAAGYGIPVPIAAIAAGHTPAQAYAPGYIKVLPLMGA